MVITNALLVSQHRGWGEAPVRVRCKGETPVRISVHYSLSGLG